MPWTARVLLASVLIALVGCSDGSSSHDPLPPSDQIILIALNEAHTGDLGGLTGADDLCMQQAKAAGRVETFRAFLSTSAFDVRDLIPPESADSAPVLNGNGQQLASSWNALIESGSWSSYYLYSFDGKTVNESSGADPDWADADGWHGSLADGTAKTGYTCNNWKSDTTAYRGANGEWDMRHLLGQETHACNTTLAVLCVGALVLPAYGDCDTPGAPCVASDACAVNPVCGADYKCRASNLRSCSDGLECTTDTCEEGGGCSNVLKAGTCAIAGQCYAAGETDSSGCKVCDPNTATDSWTPLASVCVVGSKCYQKGEQDSSGCNVCDPAQAVDSLSPRTDDHCKISGQCYAKGEQHPDGCAACDPTQSVVSWTATGNDCLIGGQCYAPGAKDSTGCNHCEPSQSKINWTPISGTICKISGKCYATGDKHPEGCAECDPSISALTWTPKGNDCLIGNKCYAPGAKDTTGCNECNPVMSKIDWSPRTGSVCTIDSKCYDQGAKHPEGCAQCDVATSTTSWTLISNDCLIDDKCYAPGALKPVGCGKCDPAVSQTSWSAQAGCWDIVLAALNNAHTGDLGGLSGADALCASQAATAGVSGTFKAFLGGTGRNVKDLVPSTAAGYPVTNLSGALLFNTWNEIFTSSTFPYANYIYTFDGKKVDEGTGASPDWYDARNWHGVNSDGTVKTGYTCQDWTSALSTDSGAAGELDQRRLIYSYTNSCNQTMAVVCVKVAP